VNYSRPKEYAIEIIRHNPLVAVVRNFATDQECKELVKAGGSDQDMGHAIKGGANKWGAGAPSSYHRSYLSSIYVDHEDRANMITHFAKWMFAFVSRVTGYEVYGPGQERGQREPAALQ
jgi:hypothetical protein